MAYGISKISEMERLVGTLDYKGTIGLLVRQALVNLMEGNYPEFVRKVEIIIRALYPLDGDEKIIWRRLNKQFTELCQQAKIFAEEQVRDYHVYLTKDEIEKKKSEFYFNFLATELEEFFFKVLLESLKKDFGILLKTAKIPR
jgi:hypothetical protein